MKGFTRVVAVELRLGLRDPMSAYFALGFPLVMLWVKLRGGDRPLPGGERLVDATVPMLTVFVVGLAALVVLPATLAQYRERRVLKRLRATPATPFMLCGAQWAAHMLLAVLGSVLLVVLGVAGYGLGAPASLPGVLLAWLLGALSLGAVGLLLGALAPSGRAATVIGLALFFPMVFLSGAVIPRETMSASMRAIGDLTPMAPAVQAIRDGWSAGVLPPLALGIMVAVSAVAGGLAVKALRW